MDDNRQLSIENVLVDIDQLMSMLNNDFNENSSLSSITNVTITDENNIQLIEQLRQRIYQLEYERNVLLTSYQLLIKLLK